MIVKANIPLFRSRGEFGPLACLSPGSALCQPEGDDFCLTGKNFSHLFFLNSSLAGILALNQLIPTLSPLLFFHVLPLGSS